MSWVKNQGLGFTTYSLGGEERHWVPDFIARIDDRNARRVMLQRPEKRSARAARRQKLS